MSVRDAQAHAGASAHERQGAGTVPAEPSVPEHQLARGNQRNPSGRFAAVRVRHAGGNAGKARLRPEQWLLIEWPASDAEPSKYFLSTLPEETPINELVSVAHWRWRIESDYQNLK